MSTRKRNRPITSHEITRLIGSIQKADPKLGMAIITFGGPDVPVNYYIIEADKGNVIEALKEVIKRKKDKCLFPTQP